MADSSRDPGGAGMTAGVVRRALTAQLTAAGIECPALEARWLMELATGRTPERLLQDDGEPMGQTEAERLAQAVARRLTGEPLTRIAGERNFYGRMFAVTPAVLDPRPETETLIDVILELADHSGGRSRALRILDVGTGSGCLLATLLAELPSATGVGTDISAAALAVARENAARHGVGARAGFAEARSLEGIEGPFDVLVSNPPYIPAQDIAGLPVEVRAFDPLHALDGGDSGLDIFKELAAGALHAVPDGWIVLEVGSGQAAAVAGLFQAALGPALRETRFRQDLGGHTRCVALLTHS